MGAVPSQRLCWPGFTIKSGECYFFRCSKVCWRPIWGIICFLCAPGSTGWTHPPRDQSPTSLRRLPVRDLIEFSLAVRPQSNFGLCFLGQKSQTTLFCYVLGFIGGRYGPWRAVTPQALSLLIWRRSLGVLTAQAGQDSTPDAACPLHTHTAPKGKAGSVWQRFCWLFTGEVVFIYCQIWIIDFLIQRCSAYALFFLCMTIPP